MTLMSDVEAHAIFERRAEESEDLDESYDIFEVTANALKAGAHAVAREQHRLCVERVRALIAKEENWRELQPRDDHGIGDARLSAMRAVLAALEGTR